MLSMFNMLLLKQLIVVYDVEFVVESVVEAVNC